MRERRPEPELDGTDLRILDLLQENCKRPLAAIGEKVGLSAPAVMERVHKLEESGVVQGYVALLDARMLGMDVTAFIGVSVAHPKLIGAFEREVARMDAVLECHHVTGAHTLLLKVRTEDTESLEELIDRIRCVEGVTRTETNVVLSTQTERTRVALDLDEPEGRQRPRRVSRERAKRPTRGTQ
jgi:Lrp/AsnC family leucine-responsive transcriptional regulator